MGNLASIASLRVSGVEGVENTIRQCVEWARSTEYPLVREWVGQHPDSKVVGYFPVYAPVEIVHAAGMLPVAMLGGGNNIDIRQADALIPSFVCSIPRSVLELSLTGKLDFVSVMLFSPICDVARNLAQIWERRIPNTKTELLLYPQNLVSQGSVASLRGEYQRLQRLLEGISGRPITREGLAHSIGLYNRQRALVRELYKMRKKSPWLLSATESYSIMRVGTMVPVEESIGLLEGIVRALPARKVKPADKLLVLYEGAFCEQPPQEFIDVLEEVCYIVDDDFIRGSRWVEDTIPVNSDPLGSLASAYRDLLSYVSVQHDDRKPKWEAFMDKVRRSGAKAVILSAPKFCEPGLDDQVPFVNALKREGIPYLASEFEEKMTSFDQAKVQVETFVESLLFYG